MAGVEIPDPEPRERELAVRVVRREEVETERSGGMGTRPGVEGTEEGCCCGSRYDAERRFPSRIE